MTLNNSMSITPMPPAKAKGARFEHGSVLGGKTRAARVNSQWKSTARACRVMIIVSPRSTSSRSLGKVSLGLRGLNFAHESPISLVDSTSRFFDDEESSMVWAFRMFTYVDPVPGVVVQERPLDLRSWGRDGVGQGLGPVRNYRVCQSRSPPKFERDR